MDGALVAAVAVSVGASFEVAALWIATGAIRFDDLVADPRTPTQRALLGFFGPLLFAAFLPAVSTPVIMAAVARSPEATASLAAFPLAMSIFTFVTLVEGGVQPTVLSLFSRGDDALGVRRFAVLVGLVGIGGGIVAAWVPPLTDLIVRDALGATDRFADLTIVGLRVLSFLPLLMAIEQLYAAALMRTKRTRALVYVNIWRLVALIAFIVIAPAVTEWSGATIGAGAVSLTLTVEALFAWLYGRGAFAELARAAR